MRSLRALSQIQTAKHSGTSQAVRGKLNGHTQRSVSTTPASPTPHINYATPPTLCYLPRFIQGGVLSIMLPVSSMVVARMKLGRPLWCNLRAREQHERRRVKSPQCCKACGRERYLRAVLQKLLNVPEAFLSTFFSSPTTHGPSPASCQDPLAFALVEVHSFRTPSAPALELHKGPGFLYFTITNNPQLTTWISHSTTWNPIISSLSIILIRPAYSLNRVNPHSCVEHIRTVTQGKTSQTI